LGEKNSYAAFSRSFNLNFGIETDVRDSQNSLVISHDMPKGGEMTLDELLKMAEGRAITFALNIKADGLAEKIDELLKSHKNKDCFVFDMAIPDMRAYLEVGIPVFTRMSEIEKTPIWFEKAKGVWLDSFDYEWYGKNEINNILSENKEVCIVSPELHKRNYLGLWEALREYSKLDRVMICTDYPEECAAFFEIQLLKSEARND